MMRSRNRQVPLTTPIEQKLNVCRLTTRRKFHGHHRHPDGNSQAEQDRSTGMAHMGSGVHSRSQNQQARRTHALKI